MPVTLGAVHTAYSLIDRSQREEGLKPHGLVIKNRFVPSLEFASVTLTDISKNIPALIPSGEEPRAYPAN